MYIVQEVDSIYATREDGVSMSEALAAWLNKIESQGYTLVAVLSDHLSWDEDRKATGTNGSRLILHNPSLVDDADRDDDGGRQGDVEANL